MFLKGVCFYHRDLGGGQCGAWTPGLAMSLLKSVLQGCLKSERP